MIMKMKNAQFYGSPWLGMPQIFTFLDTITKFSCILWKDFCTYIIEFCVV